MIALGTRVPACLRDDYGLVYPCSGIGVGRIGWHDSLHTFQFPVGTSENNFFADVALGWEHRLSSNMICQRKELTSSVKRRFFSQFKKNR